MKKIIALLLTLALALSLAACGAPTPGETTAGTTASAAGTTAPAGGETTAPAPVVDNTLVEYYMQKADEVVVTEDSVTFTDDSGRGEITVAKNPQNPAVLYGSLACLWYEAGGVSPLLIGGKSAIDLYMEQIGRDITQDEGVTIVSESSSGAEWDIEAIIAKNPDLIVCSMGMKGFESIGATAEAANIPVIAIQYDHVQDYLKWFKVFCNLTGHPELWDQVANAAAQQIIDVVSRVPSGEEAPRVAVLGVVSGVMRAYGTEAAAGTIVKELGGVNVFDDESASFESVDIDLEQLYAAAPEIIVINQRGETGATKEQLAEVINGSPVWDELDAVKNGQVYFLEKGLYHNKPNHRYQEAYLGMAQILYPDTFGAVETNEDHYPVTITNYNYAGEEVTYTYESAPERVIAVYQGSIETMIALGLEDHVLASYGLDNEVKDEWKPGFEKMNYDESVFAPDKETVTMLEPDMILSWGSLFGEKTLGDVGGWNEKGVATYMNSNTRPGGHPRTLENEYTDILNIGKIFNVEDKAQALVDEMKAQVADTVAAVEGQDPVRVAVVEPLGGNITNYGASSLAGDMVVQLGGELVKPEGNEMGKEDLVACDPDVIFVVYMAYSGDDPESVMAEQLGIIRDDPAFASLSAVQNDRVYLIMLGDMYAAGPRTIDGIKTIAAGMYPDLAQ